MPKLNPISLERMLREDQDPAWHHNIAESLRKCSKSASRDAMELLIEQADRHEKRAKQLESKKKNPSYYYSTCPVHGNRIRVHRGQRRVVCPVNGHKLRVGK